MNPRAKAGASCTHSKRSARPDGRGSREAFGVRPACRRFRCRGAGRASIAVGSHPAKATLTPQRMKGEESLCACNLRLHFGNFFWQLVLVIGLFRLEQNLLKLFFAGAGVGDRYPQDVALRRGGQ